MLQPLTYGTLDKALTRLHFESKKVSEDHVAYFNREHDVLFTLPQANYDTPVRPVHLSVVRKMIVEKGVASEEELRDLLNDEPITYAQFERALAQLGFEKQRLDESHLAFLNRTGDVLLTLPFADANALVPPVNLAIARKMIVSKGIAEEARFEALLCFGEESSPRENAIPLVVT